MQQRILHALRRVGGALKWLPSVVLVPLLVLSVLGIGGVELLVVLVLVAVQIVVLVVAKLGGALLESAGIAGQVVD